MRITKLFTVAAAAWTLGTSAALAADTSWKGNDVTKVEVTSTDNTTISADDKQLYLYNVGTGDFVNFGGHWGTQPSMHSVGQPLYITSGTEANAGDTYYQIGTRTQVGESAGYIGYVRQIDNNSSYEEDYNGLYIDRTGAGGGYDAIVRMLFTRVTEGVDDDTYIYNISFIRRYQNGSDVAHQSSGAWPTSNTTVAGTYYLEGDDAEGVVEAYTEIKSEANAQWQIVTLGDLKEALKLVDDPTVAQPADATFQVDDQNFSRGKSDYENHWTSDGTEYTNYYFGNGYSLESSDQRTYGKYWAATMKGNCSLHQSVTISEDDNELAGWYMVQLRGVASGDAVLYASVDGKTTAGSIYYSEKSLVSNSAYDGYDLQTTSINDVDKLLLEDDSYIQYVLVYAPNGGTITFGVENRGGSTSWVCFDDVQLKYCGDAEAMMLHEDYTSVTYINNQIPVSVSKTKTLYLQRTLTEDVWNSIILPVSVPTTSLKSAFGGEVKLMEMDRTELNGSEIYFKDVDLSGETSIEAHKLYIIKPSHLEDVVTEVTYLEEAERSGNSKHITVTGKFYPIPLVVVEPELLDNDGLVTSDVIESTQDNGILMKGTYINYESNAIVEQGSYALSGGDWYHLNAGGRSKGFRAWIMTDANGTTSSDTNELTFYMEEEDGTATAIEVVGAEVPSATTASADDAIYTLSGQKVAAKSLEGLAKGVYILNGKKYIVK